MADDANTPAEKTAASAGLPPSKPLQVFLLLALLITGTAYVIDEWTELTTEQVAVKHPSKLHRLVAAQNVFLSETELGREAEAKKQYSDAIIHYRHALAGEVNAEGRLNLGNALLKQGNPDMAFSQYQEAIRLDPTYEPAYLAWGRALTHQGRLDEADQVYQDALRRNPNFARVHYNFALALARKQQTALAAQHVAETANDPPAVSRNLAAAQLYASDAEKHYASAEKLGLNEPEFWSNYGLLLNERGKFAEAETCLRKAVEQKAGMGTAEFQLALAQDRQGKYGDAIAHYEAALAAIPDDPATLNDLALLYTTATNQAARSSKMAIQLAARACDATTSQNARYMDTLARAYAADNDFFQAIAWEDKAVRRAAQLSDHALLREFQPRFNLFLQHKIE